jgi:6-phosphogluconolactonase
MGQTNKEEIWVYVGSYTQESEVGISLYSLHLATGKLTRISEFSDVSNASYLAIDKNRLKLFAVSETEEFQGRPGGSVVAYNIDQRTGGLTLLNQQATHGGAPCYLSLDSTGSCLYAANYLKGNVCVFPIAEDGSLGTASDIHQHEGKGPDSSRQEGPHAHSITPDCFNRFAIAADLGIDQLIIYDMDVAGKRLVRHKIVHMNPGSGPRHIALRQKGSFLYVVNELDSTVTAMSYNSIAGDAAPFQTINTLPNNYKGENTCADIHLSPDGRFLYVSNRGHDSLALFAIEQQNGRLTAVGHFPSLGKTPRNFILTPDGEYLLVANQDSYNVRVLKVDTSTGGLSDTGHSAELSHPVCIKMLAL